MTPAALYPLCATAYSHRPAWFGYDPQGFGEAGLLKYPWAHYLMRIVQAEARRRCE